MSNYYNNFPFECQFIMVLTPISGLIWLNNRLKAWCVHQNTKATFQVAFVFLHCPGAIKFLIIQHHWHYQHQSI